MAKTSNTSSTRNSSSFYTDTTAGSSSSFTTSSLRSTGVGMSLKFNDLPMSITRESEIETLNEIYDNGNSKSTFVTIHGKAGSGKSALIESLKESWTVENENCLFASSRFDLNTSDPFAAFICILRNLVDQWSSSAEGIQQIQDYKPKIHLDEEVLHKNVPKFAEIYNQNTTTTDPTNVDTITNVTNKRSTESSKNNVMETPSGSIRRAMHHLLFYLCQLNKRVVLFLDHIESADSHSREYIEQELLRNQVKGLEGLLIIVSYNDEDLTMDHPKEKLLQPCLEKEEQEQESTTTSNWNFHTIPIQDLDLNTVNQIVSTVTKTEPDKSLPLSEIVYKKAGGNYFFILQFLRLLEDEHLLTYSFNSLKWEWADVTIIDHSMNVSDDVADIVISSMKRLEMETLQVLMIASCFGAEIPIDVLTNYLKDVVKLPTQKQINRDEAEYKEEVNDDPLLQFSIDPVRLNNEILESCVNAGILSQRNSSEPYYSWQHDKLQLAAYSMISELTRGIIHFRIGHFLYTSSSKTEENETTESDGWMVYMAADQFNRGFHLQPLSETIYSDKIADLNLRAAKLSISKSAFYPAIEMLRAGLKLLNEKTRWEDDYNLTLDIYSTLAETDYTLGNHDKVMDSVNEVLNHARGKNDKFRAQYVQLKSIAGGASRDYTKATELALDILDEHNIHLPRKPSKFHLFVASRRLRELFPDGRFDKLLNLQPTTDGNLNTLGKVISLVEQYTVIMPDGLRLYYLSSVESLRLACCQGFHDTTARAVLNIGYCKKREGKIQEACEHVDLAVKLCNKFDQSDDTTLFVKWSAFGVILPDLRPFHQCLDELLDVSQIAYRIGDTETGALAGFNYCLTYLCVGLPIGPMELDLISFGNDAQQFGLPYSTQSLFMMFRQTIMNLEGKSDYQTVLTGDAMDQDEMLDKLEGHGEAMTLRDIHTFRIILACIFRDLDAAELMMEALAKAPNTDRMFCRIHIRTVFMGLASFALARRGRTKNDGSHDSKKRKKYLTKGKEILKQIQKQVKKGSINAHPVLLMLQAEENPTKDKYDKAIASCARSGLIHYNAYMCESAGLYFLDLQDEGWAEFYLRRSCELYQDWGAYKKVNVMKSEYECLRTSGEAKIPSSALKGRARRVTDALDLFRRFNITS